MSQQLDLFGQAVGRGENDGDAQTVKNASYHDLKAAAKACGCITCAGVLENIKSAVLWRANIETEFCRDIAHRKHQARSQRRYFIQKLRDALASQTVKHNFQKEI